MTQSTGSSKISPDSADDRKKLRRQGDLLIEKANAIPPDFEPVRGRVIVRGEVTGHAHRVSTSRGARLFTPAIGSRRSPERPGLVFLEVTADSCAILHEEHAPIPLTRGIYAIWRQREFDIIHGRSRIAGD